MRASAAPILPTVRAANPQARPGRAPWVPLALGVAAVARVLWLWTKPFWRDEAWVARLARQPLDRLFQDLHPVPLGFLAAVKLTGALPLLPPEVSLRLLPLAAGLCAVPLLGALARGLGASSWTAIAAVWLAAGLPAFVYYARELKPYSLDLLLAVLVPLLALRWVEPAAGPVRRRAVAAALVACALVAPWVSFGANFVVVPTLAWVAWRGRRSALPWIAAAAFALSFTAAYGAVLGPQSEVPRLRDTWRDELSAETLGPPPVAAAVALWRYFAVSVPYLFPGLWPLAALLAAVGLFAWPRRHRGLLIALWLAPAAATVTAVLLGRYVTGHGRLLLFAAPPILLMVASGLVEAARAGGRLLGRAGGERLGVALAVVAGLGWSAQSVAHRVRPYRTDVSRYFLFDVLHDVDALVEKAERHVARGEPVMVSRYAGDAFLFYARGRLPGAVVCTRRTCPDEGPVLHAWLRGIRERGFLILLEEEERSGLRNTAGGEGLEVRTVAKARGVRLWELTRARPEP